MEFRKEESLFCKRMVELSYLSYQKDICYYTDFLTLNELTLFYRIQQELAPVTIKLWGGFEMAERKMICFYTKNSFQIPKFPICVIQVKPLNAKYSDILIHRDYLGAILNLGIERKKIGDILVEEGATLFCNEKICSFLLDNLIKIKHTNVTCSLIQPENFQFKPKLQEIHGTVSSVRLDTILSVAYQTTRSSLTGLIAGGKVFINGRITQSNSYLLKEGDVVSVRGYGKFIYQGMDYQTKKGRYSITILKYI